MFKLALNAGHGINTAGKRCLKAIDPNETREWQLNSRICNKIEAKLKAYDGYELIRLDDTTGNTDVALATRTKKANSWGADFYLAIHHNAGVGGTSGGGLETYTYPGTTGVTKEWQKDLYNACIAHSGLKGNRSNGVREHDKHEVRESNMPAVLIECGFMDSTVDVPIILTDTFAEQIADACVEVIVRRAGLKPKVVNPKGYLDGVTESGARGWAYNCKDDTPVEVHLYIYKSNGEVYNAIGGIIADKFREDLPKAGIGNGYHAFEFSYDFSALPPDTYTVKAFAIGGNNSQLSGEYKITIEAPAPVPEKVEEPIVEEVKTEAEKPEEKAEKSVDYKEDYYTTIASFPEDITEEERKSVLSIFAEFLVKLIKAIFGGKK